MKYLFLTLLLLSFISCTEDDNNNSGNSNYISLNGNVRDSDKMYFIKNPVTGEYEIVILSENSDISFNSNFQVSSITGTGSNVSIQGINSSSEENITQATYFYDNYEYNEIGTFQNAEFFISGLEEFPVSDVLSSFASSGSFELKKDGYEYEINYSFLYDGVDEIKGHFKGIPIYIGYNPEPNPYVEKTYKLYFRGSSVNDYYYPIQITYYYDNEAGEILSETQETQTQLDVFSYEKSISFYNKIGFKYELNEDVMDVSSVIIEDENGIRIFDEHVNVEKGKTFIYEISRGLYTIN